MQDRPLLDCLTAHEEGGLSDEQVENFLRLHDELGFSQEQLSETLLKARAREDSIYRRSPSPPPGGDRDEEEPAFMSSADRVVVVVDYAKFQVVPAVITMRVGATLEFRAVGCPATSKPFLDLVDAHTEATLWEGQAAQPATDGGSHPPAEYTFEAAGEFRVQSSIYPRVRGSVSVVPLEDFPTATTSGIDDEDRRPTATAAAAAAAGAGDTRIKGAAPVGQSEGVSAAAVTAHDSAGCITSGSPAAPAAASASGPAAPGAAAMPAATAVAAGRRSPAPSSPPSTLHPARAAAISATEAPSAAHEGAQTRQTPSTAALASGPPSRAVPVQVQAHVQAAARSTAAAGPSAAGGSGARGKHSSVGGTRSSATDMGVDEDTGGSQAGQGNGGWASSTQWRLAGGTAATELFVPPAAAVQQGAGSCTSAQVQAVPQHPRHVPSAPISIPTAPAPAAPAVAAAGAAAAAAVGTAGSGATGAIGQRDAKEASVRTASHTSAAAPQGEESGRGLAARGEGAAVPVAALEQDLGDAELQAQARAGAKRERKDLQRALKKSAAAAEAPLLHADEDGSADVALRADKGGGGATIAPNKAPLSVAAPASVALRAALPASPKAAPAVQTQDQGCGPGPASREPLKLLRKEAPHAAPPAPVFLANAGARLWPIAHAAGGSDAPPPPAPSMSHPPITMSSRQSDTEERLYPGGVSHPPVSLRSKQDSLSLGPQRAFSDWGRGAQLQPSKARAESPLAAASELPPQPDPVPCPAGCGSMFISPLNATRCGCRSQPPVRVSETAAMGLWELATRQQQADVLAGALGELSPDGRLAFEDLKFWIGPVCSVSAYTEDGKALYRLVDQAVERQAAGEAGGAGPAAVCSFDVLRARLDKASEGTAFQRRLPSSSADTLLAQPHCEWAALAVLVERALESAVVDASKARAALAQLAQGNTAAAAAQLDKAGAAAVVPASAATRPGAASGPAASPATKTAPAGRAPPPPPPPPVPADLPAKRAETAKAVSDKTKAALRIAAAERESARAIVARAMAGKGDRDPELMAAVAGYAAETKAAELANSAAADGKGAPVPAAAAVKVSLPVGRRPGQDKAAAAKAAAGRGAASALDLAAATLAADAAGRALQDEETAEKAALEVARQKKGKKAAKKGEATKAAAAALQAAADARLEQEEREEEALAASTAAAAAAAASAAATAAAAADRAAEAPALVAVAAAARAKEQAAAQASGLQAAATRTAAADKSASTSASTSGRTEPTVAARSAGRGERPDTVPAMKSAANGRSAAAVTASAASSLPGAAHTPSAAPPPVLPRAALAAGSAAAGQHAHHEAHENGSPGLKGASGGGKSSSTSSSTHEQEPQRSDLANGARPLAAPVRPPPGQVTPALAPTTGQQVQARVPPPAQGRGAPRQAGPLPSSRAESLACRPAAVTATATAPAASAVPPPALPVLAKAVAGAAATAPASRPTPAAVVSPPVATAALPAPPALLAAGIAPELAGTPQARSRRVSFAASSEAPSGAVVSSTPPPPVPTAAATAGTALPLPLPVPPPLPPPHSAAARPAHLAALSGVPPSSSAALSHPPSPGAPLPSPVRGALDFMQTAQQGPWQPSSADFPPLQAGPASAPRSAVPAGAVPPAASALPAGPPESVAAAQYVPLATSASSSSSGSATNGAPTSAAAPHGYQQHSQQQHPQQQQQQHGPGGQPGQQMPYRSHMDLTHQQHWQHSQHPQQHQQQHHQQHHHQQLLHPLSALPQHSQAAAVEAGRYTAMGAVSTPPYQPGPPSQSLYRPNEYPPHQQQAYAHQQHPYAHHQAAFPQPEQRATHLSHAPQHHAHQHPQQQQQQQHHHQHLVSPASHHFVEEQQTQQVMLGMFAAQQRLQQQQQKLAEQHLAEQQDLLTRQIQELQEHHLKLRATGSGSPAPLPHPAVAFQQQPPPHDLSRQPPPSRQPDVSHHHAPYRNHGGHQPPAHLDGPSAAASPTGHTAGVLPTSERRAGHGLMMRPSSGANANGTAHAPSLTAAPAPAAEASTPPVAVLLQRQSQPLPDIAGAVGDRPGAAAANVVAASVPATHTSGKAAASGPAVTSQPLAGGLDDTGGGSTPGAAASISSHSAPAPAVSVSQDPPLAGGGTDGGTSGADEVGQAHAAEDLPTRRSSGRQPSAAAGASSPGHEKRALQTLLSSALHRFQSNGRSSAAAAAEAGQWDEAPHAPVHGAGERWVDGVGADAGEQGEPEPSSDCLNAGAAARAELSRRWQETLRLAGAEHYRPAAPLASADARTAPWGRPAVSEQRPPGM